jgi:hypothetical protein
MAVTRAANYICLKRNSTQISNFVTKLLEFVCACKGIVQTSQCGENRIDRHFLNKVSGLNFNITTSGS